MVTVISIVQGMKSSLESLNDMESIILSGTFEFGFGFSLAIFMDALFAVAASVEVPALLFESIRPVSDFC